MGYDAFQHPVFDLKDIRTIRQCRCQDLLIEIGPLYFRLTPKAAACLKSALETALERASFAERSKPAKKRAHLLLVPNLKDTVKKERY